MSGLPSASHTSCRAPFSSLGRRALIILIGGQVLEQAGGLIGKRSVVPLVL